MNTKCVGAMTPFTIPPEIHDQCVWCTRLLIGSETGDFDILETPIFSTTCPQHVCQRQDPKTVKGR